MQEQSATPLLITRPQPQAGRFADQAMAALGPRIRPVLSPLMQTQDLWPDLPPGPADLILTSEAGARAASRLGLAGRAWCVGDRTAQVARQAGFSAVSAAGTVQELTQLLLARAGQGPFLWLRGREAVADLARTLRDAGLQATAVLAYDQVAVPLHPAALALLCAPGLVLAPVFSPRSARLLADALPPGLQADLRAVAISAAAAQALPPALRDRARVADSPDGPAMIRALSAALP